MSNFPDFPLAVTGQRRKGTATGRPQSALGAANNGSKVSGGGAGFGSGRSGGSVSVNRGAGRTPAVTAVAARSGNRVVRK